MIEKIYLSIMWNNKEEAKKEKIKKETIEYFESLHLKDWTLSTGFFKSGGQAAIIGVSRGKDRGGFRKLMTQDEEDIKRFKREVKILEDPEYKSLYIVEILDSSIEEPNLWYISKKGGSFSEYWEKILEKEKESPDKIVKEAISLIKKLASGLVKLHEKGVIHRDIKMANVVMNGSDPQLIDFGIAYIDGEERNTPCDKVAANKLSHPSQFYPNSGGEPWQDVFLLSQLIIAMVSVRPAKVWQGALDWRWVLYSKKMSDINVKRLYAITSACSNPYVGPKNAKEFVEVLDSVFMEEKKTNSKLSLDFDKINQMVNESEVEDMNRFSDQRQMYEDGFYLFLEQFKKMQFGFQELYNSLSTLSLQMRFVQPTDEQNNQGYKDSISSDGKNFDQTRYMPGIYLKCSNPVTKKKLSLNVIGVFGGLKQAYAKKFGISMTLAVGDPGEYNVEMELAKPRGYLAVITSDNSFDLYDSEEKKITESIDIEGLLDKIMDWLESQKLWEYLAK
ncbi:MAG: serine/threonine-protein kinase [Bacteroidota bacterium]|nr:serine/threonine-protein kinase [Bacteroidota bacterium]